MVKGKRNGKVWKSDEMRFHQNDFFAIMSLMRKMSGTLFYLGVTVMFKFCSGLEEERHFHESYVVVPLYPQSASFASSQSFPFSTVISLHGLVVAVP